MAAHGGRAAQTGADRGRSAGAGALVGVARRQPTGHWEGGPASRRGSRPLLLVHLTPVVALRRPAPRCFCPTSHNEANRGAECRLEWRRGSSRSFVDLGIGAPQTARESQDLIASGAGDKAVLPW